VKEEHPETEMSIAAHQGEPCIFLTIPEDCFKGDRVVVHATRKALRRLWHEIGDTLEELGNG
jgi:hypothetical protein